jgi:hypothetical protein
MMVLRVVCLALAIAAACHSRPSGSGEDPSDAGAPNLGVPPAERFDPDVPTWRGGCFFEGPSGKIVNGSPSPDVRLFGAACPPPGSPAGAGGLVYLDRYDPVSGSGDVTVLSAAPGSAPVVIGKNGGVGALATSATGARFDDGQARVLALQNVDFVRGDLVLADLPAGAPALTIAGGVRVENYDFLPGEAVLYVGNYDAQARAGDLFYWNRQTAQLLASQASRFDFVMYRLSPARDQVAYLQNYTTAGGGDLSVQALPPGQPSAPISSSVLGMSWTVDGQHLVFLKRNSDGVTFAIKAWDVASGVQPIAGEPPQPGVNSSAVVGNSIVYADGWNVLSQQASLHVVSAAGGTDSLGAPAPVSLVFGVAQPPALGGSGALAFVGLPSPSDHSSGDLFLASVPPGPTTLTDANVSPAAGFSFSPRASFVAYAKGFQSPQAPGNVSAQPGIATELMFAPTAGGAPRSLARSASTQRIAWDPLLERWSAGIGSFEPAGNRGELVVKDTTTGAQVLTEQRVAASWFDFGVDGATLAAIREWDDALQRGELVLADTLAPPPWTAATIDEDVTFFLGPKGDRVIYGVRGAGRDGLWLGGLP